MCALRRPLTAAKSPGVANRIDTPRSTRGGGGGMRKLAALPCPPTRWSSARAGVQPQSTRRPFSGPSQRTVWCQASRAPAGGVGAEEVLHAPAVDAAVPPDGRREPHGAGDHKARLLEDLAHGRLLGRLPRLDAAGGRLDAGVIGALERHHVRPAAAARARPGDVDDDSLAQLHDRSPPQLGKPSRVKRPSRLTTSPPTVIVPPLAGARRSHTRSQCRPLLFVAFVSGYAFAQGEVDGSADLLVEERVLSCAA